jgi:hypothetical protein
MNKFDEATEALYSGDAETASRLLAEGVALAVDPRVVAQQVRHQLAVDAENERAVEKLFNDYPEIAEDRNMALVANGLCLRLESQGLSRPQAIAAVGDEMGRKLRLGKWKPAADPAPDLESDASSIIEKMRRSRPGAL